MKFLIAGASGFLGTSLREHLESHGHTVTRLVRRETSEPGEFQWDPAAGTVPAGAIEEADVVVNLGGSPLIGNPHSQAWARQVRQSRIDTTSTIARAVARSDRRPDLLAGNGISYYGDQGMRVVDERVEAHADSLLASVSRDWQDAASAAVDAGARVCILRTSPVLDKAAPPLKLLAPLFKAGLGGPLGSGKQYFPLISLVDWVRAVTFLGEHGSASGPFNLTIPEPATNGEFTRALARAVNRPAFLKVPAPLLDKAAGALAPELLQSLGAVPRALLDEGFTFKHADVAAVVAAGLSQER